MASVPTWKPTSPRGRSPAELDAVRAQARVGAEMVRVSHDPETARLIEHVEFVQEPRDRTAAERPPPVEGGQPLVTGGVDEVNTVEAYQEAIYSDAIDKVAGR